MPTRDVKTLCPYCGVGCGIIAATDGERIHSVRGNPQHPANFGKLCPKGATVNQTVDVTTRLKNAMIRRDRRGTPEAVTPTEAVRHVADKLDHILHTHGPQSIAFYLSGQMTTEAQYVFNKFAKGVLRTNHVDSNSRLCMSSAAAGMTLSLGSDGPPTTYADIEQADTFFFIGSNAADCHPITFDRVLARLEKRTVRCVVVDPRRTATAEAATVHLAIRPGTDLALLNGILYLLDVWKKLDPGFIAKHTEGYDALRVMLRDYPPHRVSQVCNISSQDLIAAATILAESKKLLTFWTMGVSQTITGTFAANAILNLHLATGQIGKPGSGPFSLTGQPNAMGGRDVGYMAHLLPGQRQIGNAEHRAQMERIWNLPDGAIYPHAGYDAVRLFDAIDSGEIQAIWIVCSNPAASMPNLSKIRRALERAALVIVQDAYLPTETTAYADVLLPAAVNLEQTGTFCNSERRVSLMEQVVPPPGDAQPDWHWPVQVAAAMGLADSLRFESATEIFDEFARSTAGRPNDQAGLSHAALGAHGPVCWPCPTPRSHTARRYTDGIFATPSGRARFFARPFVDTDDQPDAEFPLLLTTGRLANHWHTRTKSSNAPALEKANPRPFLHMHPVDAARLQLADGQLVHVQSRHGTTRAPLRIGNAVSPGTVFLPMHWNELFAAAASPNETTGSAHDPISKQPSLKYIVVAVRAATPPPVEPVASAVSHTAP